MTLDEAIEIARKHLSDSGGEFDLVLNETPLADGSFGWVFGYQSAAYLASGHFGDQLVGNAPLLVARQTGRLFVTGTAYDTDVYIHNFLRTGDPHKAPGLRVMLLGWRAGAQTISAIKAVRDSSELGLAAAKSVVESCLEGQNPVVQCFDAAHAESLVEQLGAAGFDASQLPD